MSIYDLSYCDSRGSEHNLSEFKAKVLLIVNTATKCGLAPQFEELEQLHKKYADKGLVVLGFPCNQFLNQEPEGNDTMAAACKLNFGVTFPLTQKIHVNGPDVHPVFENLKKSLPAGRLSFLFGDKIKWNFTKFLVDREGHPFRRYEPNVSPLSMEADIVQLLG
ncbi:glutathione peroxidase [Spirochaeta dissipatitropha]